LLRRDAIAKGISNRVTSYNALNEVLETTFEGDEEVQDCDLERGVGICIKSIVGFENNVSLG
jgi:hypothetical protein